MRYTADDKGVLNNFAIEPAVTIAEYPAAVEQRHYFRQGAIAPVLAKSQFAAVIILGASLTTFVVS